MTALEAPPTAAHMRTLAQICVYTASRLAHKRPPSTRYAHFGALSKPVGSGKAVEERTIAQHLGEALDIGAGTAGLPAVCVHPPSI